MVRVGTHGGESQEDPAPPHARTESAFRGTCSLETLPPPKRLWGTQGRPGERGAPPRAWRSPCCRGLKGVGGTLVP